MPSPVDHVADAAAGGAELHRLRQLYAFPDFVKAADHDNNLSPTNVSRSHYADPVRKQFPCHTKASTWLSHLFYHEKRAEFHQKDRQQIERRLEQMAHFWGIKDAAATVARRWDELHKDAFDHLPDSMFACVDLDEDGRKTRRLPMRTPAEVKAAADWLLQYRDRRTFEQRHASARAVFDKAAAYGVALGPTVEFLERQVGRGVCEPAEVVRMLTDRADLAPTRIKNAAAARKVRDSFLAIATTVRDLPRQALQPQMLIKMATLVDNLDRHLGIAGHYTEALPRPEDVLFKATFTKASAELFAHAATTTGRVYEKSAFKRLSLDDVGALLGQDFAARVRTPLGEVDVEKMAVEAGALPLPDAELLDGLLSDNGVAPVLRKAASAARGLSAAEKAAQAAAYVRS